MGLEIESITEVGVPFEHRDGMVLLAVNDARHVVDYASENRIVVLGIETFEVRDNTVTPRLDWIADFSDLEHEQNAVRRSCEAAIKFLDTLRFSDPGDNVRVEIVLATSQ